ncbi:MAG: hypothetical protein JNG84_11305, partial [Archangium sp.]|nr:hypothetical protein [Archangium sp.]
MIRQTFLLACAVCAFSSPAWAQFDGLDLSDTAPAPTPAPAPTKKGDKKRGAEPKEVKKPEAAPAPAASLELDLSTTADVKMVLVTPPIVKVTSSTGGFAGFDTKKTSEKFDPAGHKKAVAAFEKPLDGKVLSADVAWAALTRENVSPGTVDKPASIQKLARSTKAGFVVVLDGTKSGTLAATIYDANGRTQGKPLSAKTADELAPLVAKELIELSKKTAAPVAEAPKDEPT